MIMILMMIMMIMIIIMIIMIMIMMIMISTGNDNLVLVGKLSKPLTIVTVTSFSVAFGVTIMGII